MHNDKLQVILFEYEQHRQALIHYFQTQMTALTIGGAFLGGLLTYGASIVSSSDKTAENPLLSMVLFCILIPVATAFVSIIWFDQTYRQVETGAYLALLENKINAFFITETKGKTPLSEFDYAIHWEHWNKRQFKNRGFFEKTNQFYYYICYGLYLGIPIASLLSWFLFAKPNSSAIIFSGLFIYFIICFVIVFFSYKYAKAILYYNTEIMKEPDFNNVRRE